MPVGQQAVDQAGAIGPGGRQGIQKGRGRLVAESVATPPSVGTEPIDTEVTATIRDAAGDEVAVATVTWRLEAL